MKRVAFRPGDTVLKSQPFAFVIIASHRYGAQIRYECDCKIQTPGRLCVNIAGVPLTGRLLPPAEAAGNFVPSGPSLRVVSSLSLSPLNSQKVTSLY